MTTKFAGYCVQISVGNGRHPWRPVTVDPIHETLELAIARITSTGTAASWVRVVDERGTIAASWHDGKRVELPGSAA